jgi:hypothetical protein
VPISLINAKNPDDLLLTLNSDRQPGILLDVMNAE